MIKINLLAPDSIKKEERTEILLLAYLVIVIAVICGIANYGMKFASLKKVEFRLERTQKELGKYENIVQQVEALKTTKKILETKKNVINTLMASSLIYPHFMEDLLNILPRNIWFKTLNTTLDANGRISVNLTADALDNYSIADFISALMTTNGFANPVLGTINISKADKTQTSAFQVTFSYQKQQQAQNK
jgi:Tfp pilus assembly protein PilN